MQRLLPFLFLLLALSIPSLPSKAQEPSVSDLWYFQFTGPVRHATIRSFHLIDVDFDRVGHISSMRQDGHPVTIHRSPNGRIDSTTTTPHGRLSDHHNTKYRQRATDKHGNWIARKTQQHPYIISTEFCTLTYYTSP